MSQGNGSAVTVREVAARAGVGVSTVSNALNRPQALAPQTLSRVLAAIDELGYVRNDAARALRLGASRAIGIIVSEASSPFFADVTQAASLTLGAAGFSTLVGNAVQDIAIEVQLIELFEAQRVRGLLISPMTEKPVGLSSIIARGVPVIFLDYSPGYGEFCSVSVDDAHGATLAIEHLQSRGKRRVAVVRGPVNLPQIRDRVTAARTFAEHNSLGFEEIVTSGYDVEAGIEAASVIASRPPDLRADAVFAVNDLMAMGIVSGLVDRRIDVPHEIAVVGYDDIGMAAVARVPLTTIRQPSREVGVRAAALLIDAIESPEEHSHEATRFTPQLVVRASTIW